MTEEQKVAFVKRKRRITRLLAHPEANDLIAALHDTFSPKTASFTAPDYNPYAAAQHDGQRNVIEFIEYHRKKQPVDEE